VLDVILNVQKNGSEGAECDGSGIACDAVGPDLNRDHLGLVRAT
jgi:hypothetical protein